MDRRIIRAASNALGYDVGEDRVAQAMATHESSDTRTLRSQLRERVAVFEAGGGRGIELAEEIDSLRIALAARLVARRERHQ
jgi:hypothetical protein